MNTNHSQEIRTGGSFFRSHIYSIFNSGQHISLFKIRTSYVQLIAYTLLDYFLEYPIIQSAFAFTTIAIDQLQSEPTIIEPFICSNYNLYTSPDIYISMLLPNLLIIFYARIAYIRIHLRCLLDELLLTLFRLKIHSESLGIL